MLMRFFTLSAVVAILGACAGAGPERVRQGQVQSADVRSKVLRELDETANAFVEISLGAGVHDDEYVDAYYGPEALRTKAKTQALGKPALLEKARTALASLERTTMPALGTAPDLRARAEMLRAQLRAAITKLEMLGGKKFAFVDEAEGLFATKPTLKPLSDYDALLAQVEQLVPGTGTLASRVDAFSERYTIPTDRLQPVFDAAIAECKKRTLAHIKLPAEERFTLEFVKGKPWGGYNYYQGGYRSLIQVNTDLPIRLSRAVDLGCHEGYPGHHVLGILTEQHLVRERGFREYQVYPLYSPQSVLAEGSANYGIDLAFTESERFAFERDVLYPLAGLNPSTAAAYDAMQKATEGLSGARLTIAAMYLDGQIDRAKAVELTERYMLLSPARAEQALKFADHYRSYVLNYGWGKKLVRDYIERGNPSLPTRWQRMEKILSEPTLPQDLMRAL